MSNCSYPPSRDEYDVAVIDAGSGGFSAAITAVELGASVTLIGHGLIAGVVLLIGSYLNV